MRNTALGRIRIIVTLALTVLISVAFWRIGDEDDVDSVQDRQGLMFFYLLCVTFSTGYSTITTLPMEIMMFAREQASSLYSPISYFMVKFWSETPLNVLYMSLLLFITYLITGLSLEEPEQIWTAFLIINIININIR